MTKQYENAFAEVYEIIRYLKDEDYYKIPKEIITAIEENRNKNYEFFLDESIPFTEQEILPETSAILFNLFKDYFSSEEQKQKISNKFREYEYQKEMNKKEKYYVDDIFKEKRGKSINRTEEQYLIEIKEEKWYKKIFLCIKQFFNK